VRAAWGIFALLFCFALPSFIPASSHAGNERFDYDPLGRLIRVVDEQNRVTEYVYDAAGNLLSVITSGTATTPTINTLSPDTLRRGESKRVRAAGAGLTGVRLTTSDPALQVMDVQASATQVDFTLSALDTATLGPQPITFANAAGSTTTAVIVNPVLPKVSVAPAPLAIPPDNIGRTFAVRLSNVDNIAHSFTLTSANTVIATVTPSAITIPAGQTEASASITGKQAGTTSIVLASATLGSTAFPVFVTAEFRGINTSLAPVVGLVVEQPPSPPQTQTITPFAAPHVGLVVGGYVQAVNPKAVIAGSGPVDVVITGKALSGVTAVAVRPADGVTLGSFSINTDGTAITVPITAAANAAQTLRQVVVTAGTQLIPPAAPDADRVLVAPPPPEVTSVDPLFVVPGTPNQTLAIRGRYFRNLQRVQVTPSAGIAVDSAPSVNADETAITLKLAVSPAATIGPRLITVTTASGTSSATLSPQNTLSIVNELRDSVTPIAAAVVGLIKETEAAPPAARSIDVVGPHVGLTVGSVVTGITPAAGSIGDSVTLTVQGFELQNVTAVQFLPATGITVGALAVAPDGRSLSVPITLAADAPLTLRTVQVLAGTTVLPSAPVSATQFRVTTPQARIDSISPLFLQIGQAPVTLSIRGVNYRDLQSVRVLPSEGVTLGAPTVNGDFTEINAGISAAANAVLGPRVVVVETAAGATTSVATIANTIALVSVAGSTFTPVVSPNVGLVKETPFAPVSTLIEPIVSANVGLVVAQTPPPPTPTDIFLNGAFVGLAVGPIATRVAPAGIARGSSGTLTIEGKSLDVVTAVSLQPAIGATLGAPQVNADGTVLTVPVAVATDAVAGLREVLLNTAAGTVMFSSASANRFYIAVAPARIDSISPILSTQGSTFTLTLRGANFQAASAITAEPPVGIVFGSTIVVNNTGTEITIPMFVPADSPLGSHVIRVTTPAGTTTTDAAPANTFTVFPP
jgi:YD repeat-containing protein